MLPLVLGREAVFHRARTDENTARTARSSRATSMRKYAVENVHPHSFVFPQLQSDQTFSTSTDSEPSVPTISLYVQYNGFFNQLCDLRQTTTIEELFVSVENIFREIIRN